MIDGRLRIFIGMGWGSIVVGCCIDAVNRPSLDPWKGMTGHARSPFELMDHV